MKKIKYILVITALFIVTSDLHAQKPEQLMHMIGNPSLNKIDSKVTGMLRTVIDELPNYVM